MITGILLSLAGSKIFLNWWPTLIYQEVHLSSKKRNEHRDQIPIEGLHFKGHGSHTQNYHFFTPAVEKDLAMIWGYTPRIKKFPHCNMVITNCEGSS